MGLRWLLFSSCRSRCSGMCPRVLEGFGPSAWRKPWATWQPKTAFPPGGAAHAAQGCPPACPLAGMPVHIGSGEGGVDDGRTLQQQRCQPLAAEGEFSRACAALVALPLLGDEPGEARPALLPLGPPPLGVVPDLSTDMVVQAARRFRRGGLSGLRGDHLREALASCHEDEVAVQLAAVMRLLTTGAPNWHPSSREPRSTRCPKVMLMCLPLLLVRRSAGCPANACVRLSSPRPEHACSLCRLASLRHWGAEAAIHTTQQWARRRAGQTGKVVLTVDFSNAFNAADRAALLARFAFTCLAWHAGRNGAIVSTPICFFKAQPLVLRLAFSKVINWGLYFSR